MQCNLIIIGGGFLQLPLIENAVSMGLTPVVFDMSAKAPGMQFTKYQIVMSTRDIDGCVREARNLAKKMPIHGVITTGTDASRSVAAIASALELPGIRYVDAEACSHKVLMRQRLRAHHLPIPDFYPIWSLKEAREAMDRLHFPLVLKPAENMGSRGVIKISEREEIQVAFRHTKKYSPTGEMILEEYMPGAELSVDALIWRGEVHITGIADRIISREPFFIELGHNMPSKEPAKVQEEVRQLMQKAVNALGISIGAAKGDLKLTREGMKIGEIAARLSGGLMSSHTYPLHSGANLLQAAIQIALGEEPDWQSFTPSKPQYPICIERSILAPPGKIVSLGGIKAMRSVPGIEHIHISRNVGDLIPTLTSNIDKLGHIVASGQSLSASEASVAEALRHLELELDESYGIDWQQVKELARSRFGEQICWVCKACDGMHCASGVPGMGGAGAQMESFRDNSRALAEIQIVPRYIRDSISTEVDTSIELFGRKFEYPIMAAPMTGTVTNMNGVLDECAFARILLKACCEAGSIAWVGDGASPDKYLQVMQALREQEGFGIAIFKPRQDKEALQARFQTAEELSLVAVGMDIDAIGFKTMQLKKQATLARNSLDLSKIRQLTKLPFILKGIMSKEDARSAIDVGVDAIVVSNHGGRVLDSMPGTARVLNEIVDAVRGEIPVLVDGGIRSGQDAFKMLSLGATAVLVGRPTAIAAVGGGENAVRYLFAAYARELKKTMDICGTVTCQNITQNYIRHIDLSFQTIRLIESE